MTPTPRATIGTTELSVFPLCLGGNVFGWTADERESRYVLDAYVAAGGNFVDTSDSYSAWVQGHRGGESEEILGRWMSVRGNRDEMVIATKVGRLKGRLGLSAPNIRRALDESLQRLGTEYVDVYFAHADDPETPLAETLGTFSELVEAGKVRHIAASNYPPERLDLALSTSTQHGFSRYIALQPKYNLVERPAYEGELERICHRESLACIPYYGLARGFLTGKYRDGGAGVASPRANDARAYLDTHGVGIIDALAEVAHAHQVTSAAVALAWLLAQRTVVAPIASARNREQLADLLPAVGLTLTSAELERLRAASDPRAVSPERMPT